MLEDSTRLFRLDRPPINLDSDASVWNRRQEAASAPFRTQQASSQIGNPSGPAAPAFVNVR